MIGNKLKVLAIIFLLISVCFILNDYYNVLKLENTQFDLPDGYKWGLNNKNGDMTITDGNSTLFLSKFKAEDLNKSVASYKKYCEKKNFVIETSKLKMHDTDVYKIIETSSGAEHYWFIHDGIGYSIYTWKKVNNCDQIVSDLMDKIF